MLKQQLQQKLQQKLSPQQIQVIRLLELTTAEFEERVKQELVENPALEEGPSQPDEKDPVAENDTPENESEGNNDSEDLSLGDYYSEDDIPEYKLELAIIVGRLSRSMVFCSANVSSKSCARSCASSTPCNKSMPSACGNCTAPTMAR